MLILVQPDMGTALMILFIGATIMFAGNFTGRTQTVPLAILSAMESDLTAALAISVLALAASAAVLVLLALLSRRSGRPSYGL